MIGRSAAAKWVKGVQYVMTMECVSNASMTSLQQLMSMDCVNVGLSHSASILLATASAAGLMHAKCASIRNNQLTLCLIAMNVWTLRQT